MYLYFLIYYHQLYGYVTMKNLNTNFKPFMILSSFNPLGPSKPNLVVLNLILGIGTLS